MLATFRQYRILLALALLLSALIAYVSMNQSRRVHVDSYPKKGMEYRYTWKLRDIPQFPFFEYQKDFIGMTRTAPVGALNRVDVSFDSESGMAHFKSIYSSTGRIQVEGDCTFEESDFIDFGVVPYPDMNDVINAQSYDYSGRLLTEVKDGWGMVVWVDERNRPYSFVSVTRGKGRTLSRDEVEALDLYEKYNLNRNE